MGIVEVVFLAASAGKLLPTAAINATRACTSSAAIAGNRSYSSFAQRDSMATFWPSTKPVSFSPLHERGHAGPIALRRCAAENPNHRHRRSLRVRGERPYEAGAAEKGDELAPLHRSTCHSITLSAIASNVGGTSMRSNLAVDRLMTSSNRVGRITGRSAGFSPLRMRPT